MTRLEQWSLEKFATPEDPFGMNTYHRLEGVDPKTSVETSVNSYHIGDIYSNGYISARRVDATRFGYRREIYKAIGCKKCYIMGYLIENPHPYDHIAIRTPRRRDSLDLTSLARLKLSGYDRLFQELDKDQEADQMSWFLGRRRHPEIRPEDVEVLLSTELNINRVAHLREYRFKAVYGNTLVGADSDAPLSVIEFGIKPTTMEIDGKRFSIDPSGPVNYLEVDGYVTSRGIEKNLEEVKRLLDSASKTAGESDSSLTHDHRLDEQGLDNQINLVSSVGEISKRRIKRIVAATAKALQTVDNTDLTPVQRTALGKWVGLQLSRKNHNLSYSITDPESLVQAANRHLASEIADYYRREQAEQEMTMRFERGDDDLWKIYSADGVVISSLFNPREGFEETSQEMSDFYMIHKHVSFDVSRANHLPGTVTAKERVLRTVFGDDDSQDAIEGDFLQFKVQGLPRPTRLFTYIIPMGVNNDTFHNIGSTPNVNGWQTAMSSFPYRFFAE